MMIMRSDSLSNMCGSSQHWLRGGFFTRIRGLFVEWLSGVVDCIKNLHSSIPTIALGLEDGK